MCSSDLDIFQLATAVLFQNPVQMFALTPNNLTDVPSFEIDFMKQVPTTWDETRYIDGSPGKYVVIARRHGNTWYVAGVNAEKNALKLKLNLPMLSNHNVCLYSDDDELKPTFKKIKVKHGGLLAKIPNHNQYQVMTYPLQGLVLLIYNVPY